MENCYVLCQFGVVGLLWIQVMMVVMVIWLEFNFDFFVGMDCILCWVSLIFIMLIVFYCCGQFFCGVLCDLCICYLIMDVLVLLVIGGVYVVGIWLMIIGQGELYFDVVGMFVLFFFVGCYFECCVWECIVVFIV